MGSLIAVPCGAEAVRRLEEASAACEAAREFVRRELPGLLPESGGAVCAYLERLLSRAQQAAEDVIEYERFEL